MSSAEITPFTIAVPDDEVEDLRRRLRITRWPESATVDGWSQGVPLEYAREICDYWAESYDWRRGEAHLNAVPNFVTEIRGLAIHFQHIRSRHERATPMILTHGWPGSVREFQKVIGPLTDPTAHGGKPDDAFHLVLPSLPGFGWSAKPTAAGTGVEAIAEMWDELMLRLGYDEYVAQGGDWGSIITTAIGIQNRGRCQAIHINMPLARPTAQDMEDPTPEEVAAHEAFAYFLSTDSGYAKIQATRPQTIGYGLVDSPAGLATWILEKFWSWSDRDRHPEDSFTRDELLDNISIYWFTATGASSARLYWESFGADRPGVVTMPSGCSLFPHEIFGSSRRWAERKLRDIRYWNVVDRGGHFAAFEQPDLYVSEVRAAFRALL